MSEVGVGLQHGHFQRQCSGVNAVISMGTGRHCTPLSLTFKKGFQKNPPLGSFGSNFQFDMGNMSTSLSTTTPSSLCQYKPCACCHSL